MEYISIPQQMVCADTGLLCYYLPEEKVLFSGDTLFAESLGRTDLPTGSMSAIVHSIAEKLLVLPDDIMVCSVPMVPERFRNGSFSIRSSSIWT